MRRSDMPQRKTPLTSSKPLKRATAPNASPQARSALHAQAAERSHQPKAKRRPPAIPAKVRAALAERSQGGCEIAAPGCTGVATDASHRVKVGMGGRKGDAATAHHVLSNLLHVDRHCHSRHLHAEPTAAYLAGWMLREYLNPAAEPCLYRGQLRWLTDSGLVLSAVPDLAEEAA
jgi:hypothetical protein